MISVPIFSSAPPLPHRLHSTRVPLPICYTHPCGVGAGRLFRGASSMHVYPTVRGCEVDVMSVSCRQKLKYIIIYIYVTATAARQGGRWQPTLWICLDFEPPRMQITQSIFSFFCVPLRTVRSGSEWIVNN
jgi:hypothetical protein